MSPELFTALGAFLSGIASVLTAMYFVRRMTKRMEKECEDKMNAFKEGIKLGREE